MLLAGAVDMEWDAGGCEPKEPQLTGVDRSIMV